MKIHSVQAELLHVTDMTKLIVTFCNSVNLPSKLQHILTPKKPSSQPADTWKS